MRLDQDTIDDGRAHPFVEEVINELRRREAAHVKRLIDLASTGEASAALMSSVGGRCNGLREALSVITSAQEKPE